MAPEMNHNGVSSPVHQKPSLGFTIVGDGDDVRILVDAGMISTIRQSSLWSLSSEQADYENHGVAWTCELCCYENADGCSNMCSVCGTKRAAEPNPLPERDDDPSNKPKDNKAEHPGANVEAEASSGRVDEEEKRGEDQYSETEDEAKTQVTEDPMKTENETKTQVKEDPMKSLTNAKESLPNQEGESPKEDFEDRGTQRRASISSQGSKKTTTSFQELMSMSFANWSLSDNGPWQCTTCTYVNQETLHLTCAVCGEARTKSNTSSNQKSLHDQFNSSLASTEAMRLAGCDIVFNEFGGKLMERERMNETIADQFRILSGLQTPQEEKSTENENASPGNLEESWQKLEEAKRTIARLENQLAIERHEQQVAEEAQRRRQLELQRRTESSAGDGECSNFDRNESSMELMAQQKLLDDWKNNWEVREAQLEYVRTQQANLLQRYQRWE